MKKDLFVEYLSVGQCTSTLSVGGDQVTTGLLSVASIVATKPVNPQEDPSAQGQDFTLNTISNTQGDRTILVKKVSVTMKHAHRVQLGSSVAGTPVLDAKLSSEYTESNGLYTSTFEVDDPNDANAQLVAGQNSYTKIIVHPPDGASAAQIEQLRNLQSSDLVDVQVLDADDASISHKPLSSTTTRPSLLSVGGDVLVQQDLLVDGEIVAPRAHLTSAWLTDVTISNVLSTNRLDVGQSEAKTGVFTESITAPLATFTTLTVEEDAEVQRHLSVNEDLNVSGTTKLCDGKAIVADWVVEDDLSVARVSVPADAKVRLLNATTEMDRDLSVGANLKVMGVLSVNETVAEKLSVGTLHVSQVSIDGGNTEFNFEDDATFSGDMTVHGKLFVNDILFTGPGGVFTVEDMAALGWVTVKHDLTAENMIKADTFMHTPEMQVSDKAYVKQLSGGEVDLAANENGLVFKSADLQITSKTIMQDDVQMDEKLEVTGLTTLGSLSLDKVVNNLNVDGIVASGHGVSVETGGVLVKDGGLTVQIGQTTTQALVAQQVTAQGISVLTNDIEVDQGHILVTTGEVRVNNKLSVGQAFVNASVSVGGSMHIAGDLIVDGTSTTLNSQTLTTVDPRIVVNSDNEGGDAGVLVGLAGADKKAALVFDAGKKLSIYQRYDEDGTGEDNELGVVKTGSIELQDHLIVGQDVTIGGETSVTSLTATGDTSLAKLDVDGETYLGMTTTQALIAQQVTAQGISVLTNDIEVDQGHILVTTGEVRVNNKLSVGQAFVNASVSVGGSMHIAGDLIVDGTSTTLNSQTLTTVDPRIVVNSDNEGGDAGVLVGLAGADKKAALVFDAGKKLSIYQRYDEDGTGEDNELGVVKTGSIELQDHLIVGQDVTIGGETSVTSLTATGDTSLAKLDVDGETYLGMTTIDTLAATGDVTASGDVTVTSEGSLTANGTLVFSPTKPALPNAAGQLGQFSLDKQYLYVCVKAGDVTEAQWRRVALSNWVAA